MAELTTRSAGALLDLVDSVRAVTAQGLTPSQTTEQVADCLHPILERSDLLRPDQTEGYADTYRQHILHVEPDGSFSVVALVWLPGQYTPVHDHVCWCTVGVYRGEETEERFQLVTEREHAWLVGSGRTVNVQGSACGIAPPGDIHRVRNTGTTKAISLHVYGANIGRLGTSIRRCYDLPVAG